MTSWKSDPQKTWTSTSWHTKLTDCDGENAETDTSLDFAKSCGYITAKHHESLTAQCHEIGREFGSKLNNPELFLQKSARRPPTSAP